MSPQEQTLLIATLRDMLDALERIAFRSNTLGQKKDIARKAIWAVPDCVNDLVKEKIDDLS